MNDDEVVNQIEQKSQEIHMMEDKLTELNKTLFKNVSKINSVDEINYDGPGWGTVDDGPGWGTVIACFLFGWIFGD